MAADEIDFLSSDFKPDLALRSTDVILPFPKAKTFDNLTQYKEFAKGKLKQGQSKKKIEQITEENENIEQPSISNLSGQQEKQDVIKRMKTSFNKGPLYILTKCVQERKRVKVTTRNHSEIRGTCTGYIVAFDKHWNLAMTDVDEEYMKSIKLKTPILKKFDMCEFSSFQEPASELSEKIIFVEDDIESESLSFLPVLHNSSKDLYNEMIATNQIKNIEVKQLRQARNTNINLVTSSLNIENLEEFSKENISCNTIESDNKKNLECTEKCSTFLEMTETVDSKIRKINSRKKKTKKNFDICKRHINQIFIRGDNVVMIRILECS